jgi:hypothetical protein
VEPSLPADPSSAGAPVRKPRILSASSLPITQVSAEASIRSQPQPKPSVSVSQLARAHCERLNTARVGIFKQQNELQAKLNAIDCELRAIDAYEAAKRRGARKLLTSMGALSKRATIVRPMQERLALPSPAGQVPGFAIPFDLTYVPAHPAPPPDLSRVLFR